MQLHDSYQYVYARDLQTSARWYDEQSGFKIAKEDPYFVDEITKYAGDTFRFRDPDGNAIEIWPDYPPTP